MERMKRFRVVGQFTIPAIVYVNAVSAEEAMEKAASGDFIEESRSERKLEEFEPDHAEPDGRP